MITQPTTPISSTRPDHDPARTWLLNHARDWRAEHAADMTAVRDWHERILDDLPPSAAVPRLGSPSWVALLDSDPLKLAAAIPPAVAYLTENTPAAIASRLRRELAAIDHTVIERIRTTSWDLAGAQDWRHAANSPSHAELVRRRLMTICGKCATRYAWTAPRCPGCGRTGTPEEIHAAATRPWDYTLHTGQGAPRARKVRSLQGGDLAGHGASAEMTAWPLKPPCGRLQTTSSCVG